MYWIITIGMACCIGIASNLDNIGVAMAYGSNGVRFPHRINALVNLIGLCTAFIGAMAGRWVSHRLPIMDAKWVSCLMFCGFGLYALCAQYVRPGADLPILGKLVSREPGLAQGVILGLALSFTNVATGFSSTVDSALSPWLMSVSIAIWGFLVMWLGNHFSIYVFTKFLGRYSALVSCLLLLTVGVLQVT